MSAHLFIYSSPFGVLKTIHPLITLQSLLQTDLSLELHTGESNCLHVSSAYISKRHLKPMTYKTEALLFPNLILSLSSAQRWQRHFTSQANSLELELILISSLLHLTSKASANHVSSASKYIKNRAGTSPPLPPGPSHQHPLPGPLQQPLSWSSGLCTQCPTQKPE